MRKKLILMSLFLLCSCEAEYENGNLGYAIIDKTLHSFDKAYRSGHTGITLCVHLVCCDTDVEFAYGSDVMLFSKYPENFKFAYTCAGLLK